MRTVRRQLGAFVAVFAGVAVAACATLLMTSSHPAVPDRLARADVLVQSPEARTPADPFPPAVPWSTPAAAGLTGRLAAVPGVAAAIADRSFYAQPLGDDRIIEGHGWASARLSRSRLTAGRPPQRAGEVVLDRPLGPITLLTAAGPVPYTVTGTISSPELYLTDEAAAALSPGVRVIGLTLAPGADPVRVAAEARRVIGMAGRVHVGAARGALEPRGDARTRWVGLQILTGTAALATFATIFVVAATFALTVAHRRRELALLRTIGATPRQVGRLLRREALTVGAAGSSAGTVAGIVAAPLLAGVLTRAGAEPAGFTVRFALWPIAAALLLGPVVATVGVSVAARRAAGIRPLEALRDADVDQRPMGRLRWFCGCLALGSGAGAGAAAVAADDAGDAGTLALFAAMALVTGAAVLAPAVVPATARVLTWPLRRRPGALPLLVRQGALAAPRRTAATAAPVLLTVAFAVLVSGLVQTSAAAYETRRGTAVLADRVLAPDATPGLTDAAVAPVSGVAVLPTTVFAGDRPLTALGVDPVAYPRAQRRMTVVSGSPAALAEPGTVAIAASLGPATVLPLTLADGSRAALRVVAVIADGSVPGDLLISRELARRHDPSALTSAVFMSGAEAVTAGPGARVTSMARYAAETGSADDRLVWLFTLLLIGVSAGYGAVAVVTTLLMSAASRRPDRQVLWRAGATSGQVRRALAGEAALVVTVGSLLGGAVSAVALLGIRSGLSAQVGTPVRLVVPWPVIGSVIATCLFLAMTAAVLPTLQGSCGRRRRPEARVLRSGGSGRPRIPSDTGVPSEPQPLPDRHRSPGPRGGGAGGPSGGSRSP